ncbi:MAG: DUF3516 domain-containing protein, partial [Polyangiales bacterium]
WAEYDELLIDPDARSAAQFDVVRKPNAWAFSQILVDPRKDRAWRMVAQVDLVASRDAGAPRFRLESISE